MGGLGEETESFHSVCDGQPILWAIDWIAASRLAILNQSAILVQVMA